MPQSTSKGFGQAALLTGGGDRPYALGLASSLIAQRIELDFVGSDDLEAPELLDSPWVRFLNLRGDQRPDASLLRKAVRVCKYYARLTAYAAKSKPRVFHILWNNKFELFDRTLLLAYYRALGKRLVLTVHNVNIGQRDGNDGFLNRLTLRIQYGLSDHLFVHTERMRQELIDGFRVRPEKITVIPFGINSTTPTTGLTRDQARTRLGLDAAHKTLLFFGNIAPYKGLEYLVRAMADVRAKYPDCRLLIAGRPKGPESYWDSIQDEIVSRGLQDCVIPRSEYIADEDVEVFFKAADVLMLPYTVVFQSGVLFLGYSFGLPAIVSDVGSLRDDVEEGVTGFVCRPGDAADLARAVDRCFSSGILSTLDAHRAAIREIAGKRHSWELVGAATRQVYEALWTSG
jgi:D-inositol-3-phosphate glycosyltransferase